MARWTVLNKNSFHPAILIIGIILSVFMVVISFVMLYRLIHTDYFKKVDGTRKTSLI